MSYLKTITTKWRAVKFDEVPRKIINIYRHHLIYRMQKNDPWRTLFHNFKTSTSYLYMHIFFSDLHRQWKRSVIEKYKNTSRRNQRINFDHLTKFRECIQSLIEKNILLTEWSIIEKSSIIETKNSKCPFYNRQFCKELRGERCSFQVFSYTTYLWYLRYLLSRWRRW